MGFLIGTFFEWVSDQIEEIETPLFKGLIILAIIIILILVILWLVYNLMVGKWLTTVIIIGIWIVLEIANWIGGGWS